jgi:hypothetical protein
MGTRAGLWSRCAGGGWESFDAVPHRCNLLTKRDEFLGDFCGRCSSEGLRDQTLSVIQLTALKGQRGGAAVEDGAGWFGGEVVREQAGSLALCFKSLLQQLVCVSVVATVPCRVRLLGERHRLVMEVANQFHLFTTYAIGRLNSTTTT